MMAYNEVWLRIDSMNEVQHYDKGDHKLCKRRTQKHKRVNQVRQEGRNVVDYNVQKAFELGPNMNYSL